MRKFIYILLFLFPYRGMCVEVLSTSPGWGNDVYVIGIKDGETKISSWVSFTICSGSGTCALTSMSGHSYGDVANVTPGTYSFGDFEHLNGITLQPLSSAIGWSGEVLVANDSNCNFLGNTLSGVTYGFVSSGGSTGISFSNANIGLRFWNWHFTGLSGNAFDASSTGMTYDQVHDNTKAIRNCTFGNILVTGCDEVMQGSFNGVIAQDDVIDSIEFVDLIDSSMAGSENQIGGDGFYRMLIEGGSITGNLPNAVNDIGLIQISGNCVIRNLYREGGYGYILRNVIANLIGESSDSYMIGVIDIDGHKYGTADVRSGEDFVGTSYIGVAGLSGGSFWGLNNTSGNKKDTTNSYTTVMWVVTNMAPNGQFHAYNNFSYNTHPIQDHSMYQINTADPLDTGNNLYWFTANGNLQDSLATLMPLALPLLPLNSGGTNESAIYLTDHYGVAWAGVYGRGAVKYVSGIIPPQTMKFLRAKVVNG